MRVTFHAELDDLVGELAGMTRLAGQMMINASTALDQADLVLAELVIGSDEMNALHDDIERRCIDMLALQAPVAADLRTVIAALHAVGDLKRMGNLAQHIAKIARLKHPTPVIQCSVRPILARMSLLANQLAANAATAIEKRDPLAGGQLAEIDDEVNVLRRRLFGVLFAEHWSHGVEPAVDAALLGRYYERFADHAVAIAQRVSYLATGRVSAAVG